MIENTREHEGLQQRADRDDLTGLLRYQRFQDLCKVRGILDQSDGVALIVFIDADNLKLINDGLGHTIGDKFIIEVARILSASLPKKAIICRKGGDEFVAAMYCRDSNIGKAIVQDLHAALSKSCTLDGHEIPIRCSLGVSINERESFSLSEHIQRADIAMYWAKSCGKNQVKFYSDDSCKEFVVMRNLSMKFPEALQRGKLSVVFQPIYKMGLQNSKLVGAEALVRWRHKKYGSIPAEQIVRLAQKSGRRAALGRFVLKLACEAAATWPRSTFVSVNFSAADFLSIDFGRTVTKILDDVGLAASRLRIEITESELLELNDVVQGNVDSLRKRGVRIGVDDFGTGYSSMGNIDGFPADFVKIDRSLVAGCQRRPSSKIFIKAIKSVSDKIGFELIAEGVETLQELAIVRGSGICLAQGFYLCRPLASTDAQVLMRRAEAGGPSLLRSKA